MLGLSAAGKTTCATCGEPLKTERRRPGRRASTRRFEKTTAERRDVTAPPAA